MIESKQIDDTNYVLTGFIAKLRFEAIIQIGLSTIIIAYVYRLYTLYGKSEFLFIDYLIMLSALLCFWSNLYKVFSRHSYNYAYSIYYAFTNITMTRLYAALYESVPNKNSSGDGPTNTEGPSEI